MPNFPAVADELARLFSLHFPRTSAENYKQGALSLNVFFQELQERDQHSEVECQRILVHCWTLASGKLEAMRMPMPRSEEEMPKEPVLRA